MTKKIVVILGPPDPGPSYCRALADAYKILGSRLFETFACPAQRTIRTLRTRL